MSRSLHGKVSETAVSVVDFGATGDGTTNDTTACQNALDTGRDVHFPEDMVFLVNGLSCATAGQRIYLDGTVKKRTGSSATVSVFTINDVAGVQFVGNGTIDGNRSAFTFPAQNPSGIAAYRAESLLVDGIMITECMDCGIKAFNCPNLVTTAATRFYKIKVNGIEIDSYVNDPRTGSPWSGSPQVQSPSGDINGFFDWIDDGLKGVGEGNGVIFSPRSPGALPVCNLRISGRYRDCLRGIWSEDNVGVPSLNIVIDSPVILGNYRGSTGPNAVETKDGIGLIGVKNATIISPTIRNVGNFATASNAECTGITIGGAETDGVIVIAPEITDDTGNTDRTDYSIRINYGANIAIIGGHVSGASMAEIAFSTDPFAVFENVRIECVSGAQLDYSWGNIASYNFSLQDVPTNATTPLLANGQAGIALSFFPCAGRVIGQGVVTSAAGAGNFSYKVYVTDGATTVEQTGVRMTQANFGGGTQARTQIATPSALQSQSGDQLKVEITTDASWVNTVDVNVLVWVDLGMKK